MDLCLEPGGQRIDALRQMQDLLQQLLGAADQLDENLLAVHICHALDQAEQSIRHASASTV
ncbi:hypothetical protein SPHI_22230 [Sphingomonas jeddahensis]|uniref:Uncharacterized protein n=1 Tax=Sphingomonas jeddahensis TaxID=1915074 RepID=A0A1V2ESB1_9SPHN|nr:hypothetical protein SPHI_22230 [Sphingomonas jeddahensis]